MVKNTYYVIAKMAYSEEGQMYERGLETLFNSENDDSAVIEGILWALDRQKNLSSLYDNLRGICCVKVGPYHIEEIDDKGECKTGRGAKLYEWKFDTFPTTLEQEIEIRKKKT